MTQTALAADPICREHDTGWGHPECAPRFDAVMDSLREGGVAEKMRLLPQRSATFEEVALCHSHRYLERARREIESGRGELSTGDTMVCARSWEVALRACGGVLEAVDAVAGGGNAFCVVRPPGHHATSERGMGFCVVNNIAVAARYAQRRHGIGRVLIVDWDVHHGNGTQDIFYRDGSVFYFSTHQWPWYPGTGARHETGEGEGEGATLNCPLPAGSGRAEVLGAFERELLPAMERFRPELVLVSAGFDSRLGDPLGEFRLLDDDFRDLTKLVLGVADRYAGGRLVSVLEGGYRLESLAAAAAAHAATLVEAVG